MNMMINFDNTWFNALPNLYSPVEPKPLVNGQLLYVNEHLAQALAIDSTLFTGQHRGVWQGESLLPGMQPLAQIYSGHQFGVWAGQLGDGRGLLLGEQRLADGRKMDWHLKGAGLTPYSRMGDGRAVIRSSVREFLASEALHALGVPTTRALTLTLSDSPVYREQEERGAMLLRVADSHLRFGHFEQVYYSQSPEAVRQLADYAIEHHWPHFQHEADKYGLWFADVITRTAQLIAQWQTIGFAHGVMNTDNMSVLGLTLDYGPYGFMDDYQPGFICNHSDYQGRYAFDNQPAVGLWNLQRLGQCLSVLMSADKLNDLLDGYQSALLTAYGHRMRSKLGFFTAQKNDNAILSELLALMAREGSDYTLVFRSLCHTEQHSAASPLRDSIIDRAAFDSWFATYRRRLQDEQIDDATRQQAMKSVNPALVLRNWLAQQAIEGAERGDASPLAALHQALRQPFMDRDDAFTQRPPAWGKTLSVSCSS